MRSFSSVLNFCEGEFVGYSVKVPSYLRNCAQLPYIAEIAENLCDFLLEKPCKKGPK